MQRNGNYAPGVVGRDALEFAGVRYSNSRELLVPHCPGSFVRRDALIALYISYLSDKNKAAGTKPAASFLFCVCRVNYILLFT